ncbi:MAG: hypothetical protein WBG34_04710, partial [Flavobacteriales bacterium]
MGFVQVTKLYPAENVPQFHSDRSSIAQAILPYEPYLIPPRRGRVVMLMGTSKNLTPAALTLSGKHFSFGHPALLLSQLPTGNFLSSRLGC